MSIKRILLDMDDVLCSCSDDIMIHMGLSGWGRRHYTRRDRDIIAMYHQATGIKYDVPTFWEHFNRKFWANIQPTPWCEELISMCLEFVPREDIAICTSPTKCGDCMAGKLDWIQAFMPDWLQRQYIMTPRKDFCAAPGTVLIDDADENTEPFGKAGGMPITLPQPWNSIRRNVGEELTYVRGWLEGYQSGDWS